MKQVWKYILYPRVVLEMPKGAEILSVGEQDRDICLWALVDIEAPKELVGFSAFGTGQDIHYDDITFIDTVQLLNGLVFHIFRDDTVTH